MCVAAAPSNLVYCLLFEDDLQRFQSKIMNLHVLNIVQLEQHPKLSGSNFEAFLLYSWVGGVGSEAVILVL